MPYIIPGAAIGGGLALVVWGTRKIVEGDDSADEAAAKVLRGVPDYIRRYVEEIDVSATGVRIKLREDAPESTEQEIADNIDIEDRLNGVDIER
jgi:hypothetical protein